MKEKEKEKCATHQPDDDEEYLYDVSVRHRDEAAQEGVAQGDHGGAEDGHLLVQVQDHLECTGVKWCPDSVTWLCYTVSRYEVHRYTSYLETVYSVQYLEGTVQYLEVV